MTCRKSSSSTALRNAGMLFLPFGGKTSPWGEGRSALALPLAWGPLFDCVRSVALAKRQITMSQHYQSDMTVKSSPKASLVMIKPQFSFGVLVESLDNPADMSEFNQFFQAERVQFPGKIILEIFLSSRLGDGTLSQEPTRTGK